MILNCENKKGCKFTIDTENKMITWDIEGFNKKGHLEKLTADHGEYIEVILTGVSSYHRNGNSYMTPYIFKDDIISCNDWQQLERLYTYY